MLEKTLWGNIRLFDVIEAAAILILTVLAAKTLSLYLRRFLKDKLSKDHLQLVTKLVRFSVYVIGFFSAFAVLGLNLTGLLFAGSIAGVILGFASQSIIGNFFSGLFLIIERPMKIGDQVMIMDATGFVEDIRILSTTLRTYDGLAVRLPNQTVFTNKMTNFVSNTVRRFEYVVGIRYSDDADEAIRIIKGQIQEQPFALVKPIPQVFVDNLGDNAVNIIVRVWAPVSEWYSLKMELLWKIKKALENQGIEIAFPQRTLWFANRVALEKDGERS
jgi:small-conductance mechanosensitive channel